MPIDIILYGVIAGGLIFWLRNILGETHGDETDRPNPFLSDKTEDSKKSAANPARSAAPSSSVIDNVTPIEEAEATLERHMSVTPTASENLLGIRAIDRNFSLPAFMSAAQNAFTIIIESFAEGDRATLKNLLSEKVYKAFGGALDAREKAGETADVEIHAIREMEVISAETDGKKGRITIRFVADETNVLRDKDGELIYGDPERITETIDIWTFERDLKSRNPAWLLCETRDEDAAGDDHKTVPDAQK